MIHHELLKNVNYL